MIVIFYYYPSARKRRRELGRGKRFLDGSWGEGSIEEARMKRERERTVNKEEEEEEEKWDEKKGVGWRGIEKQFTRKSALDLFAPRRLFLIGISCYIADGFCVLLRMLFIQPTLQRCCNFEAQELRFESDSEFLLFQFRQGMIFLKWAVE